MKFPIKWHRKGSKLKAANLKNNIKINNIYNCFNAIIVHIKIMKKFINKNESNIKVYFMIEVIIMIW